MARGRRFSQHSSTVAHKQWSTVMNGQIVALDLAEGTVAVGDIAGVFQGASTLLRTRGGLLIELDAAGAGERALVAVGIIIAGDRAIAAGVASLPSPVGQGEDDWLWHSYLTVTSNEEAAATTDYLTQRLEIDSKAMRKVRDDEGIVFMAEVAESADMGGSVNLMYGTRILLGA